MVPTCNDFILIQILTEKENSAVIWWLMSQRQINEGKQQSILQKEKDVKASRFEDSNWSRPSRLFRGMGNAGPP